MSVMAASAALRRAMRIEGARPPRSGMTLLELLVVLVLLGLLAGVGGLSMRAAPAERPIAPEAVRVAAARQEAVRSGRMVTIELVVDGRPVSVTALPDGSVLAENITGLDRLAGRVTRGAGESGPTHGTVP